jgi:putative ABC transport system permease protein
MRTVARAIRALIRSPMRAALLVGVLAVSIGLALIMITVNGAFAQRLDDINGRVGTSITLRPAGSFGGGFFGGDGRGGDNAPGTNANAGTTANGNNSTNGNTATTPTTAPTQPTVLAATDLDKVAAISHVVSVSGQITVPYSGTGLVSAVQGRQGTNAAAAQATPRPGANFRQRPVLVTGIDDPTSLATLGVTNAQATAGRTFTDSEANANVAVMGQALATQNNLAVGDTFPINDQTFQLIGTFTTGTQFGDNSLFIPLGTAQTVFSRPGEVDQAVVKVDTTASVDQAATDIRATLGADNVDVVTDSTLVQAISAPLSDAKDSSQIGMLVALVASAAVILFSIGLVARQRIKEIGILKAVGASNWHVIGQFGVETAIISVGAALVGALATFPLAQSVADSLISQPTTGGGGFGGGGAGRAGAAAAARAGGVLGSVDVAVSPEVFLYALGIAIGLAIIATVVPAWYVGRVRPAEVLRNE